MASSPPPGMYIDPDDPRQQRFWNGVAWTDHVSPVEGSAPGPMYAPLPAHPTAPPLMPPAPPVYGSTPPYPTTPIYPTYPAGTPSAGTPSLPPPYPGGAYGGGLQAMPYAQRPLSQAAVWSIVLALFCPLVGIVFAIVALTATGASGDRRGRTAAIVGLILCILSVLGGFILGYQMAANSGITEPGSTGPTF